MLPADACLLKIYVNASDRWRRQPLYKLVVETARMLGMAGASVFLVDLSYGVHRRIADSKSEYRSFDIPVVIELVDAPLQLNALLDDLAGKISRVFATIEPVRVIHYEHHPD